MTDSSRCASISAASVESSDASSPECGVITVDPPRSNGSSDQSASASSTIGTRTSSRRIRTRSRVPSLRPRPGPRTTAFARSAASSTDSADLGRSRPAVSSGKRPLDRLEHARFDRRERRLGRGHGDVPRVGPKGGQRRERRGAGLPGRAADDEDGAGAVLVRIGALARNVVERGRGDEPRLVAGRLRRSEATTAAPAWKRPSATASPIFAAPKVTVTSARTAAPGLAGGRIHPRGARRPRPPACPRR